MPGRISRRTYLRALGATLAAGALVASVSPADASAESGLKAPAFVPAAGRNVAAQQDQLTPPQQPATPTELPTPVPTPEPPPATATPAPALAAPAPRPAPPNVWAASASNAIPAAVADLPPRVYVPHELGGDIAVIDPISMQIVDRFWVGRTPHHVAPAYDFSQLYVNVMDSNYLTVIDPRTGRPAGTLPAAVPYNLYFTPDGTKAVVAAERFNRLDFHDISTWAVIARLPIPGSGVDHMDFSADGSYLLVSCEFGGQVVKVGTDPPRVLGVYRGGRLPIDVKLNPEGTHFFVADQGRHGVIVVEPESMTEAAFIPTGRGAHGMAIARDTRALYVTNRLAGTLSVIDMAAFGVAQTWYIGGSPDMVQVSPDGQQIWISARNHGYVQVIDSNNGAVIARIPTGAAPHGLTYFPQPGRFSIGHNGVYR
ncbi:MAG TPA: cytochrome D1 domain-containing protein [Chloroflexota bacterium]|nr:cytochrome D1 domain-containing protein [Chloroflexota bacterium]